VAHKEMKMNKLIERVTLLAAGAGIATCVFIATAGSPAYAQVGTVYKVVQTASPQHLQEVLNAESAQGWDYIGNSGGAAIFKR